MQDRQVDRAAGFFLSNKRFIDFMNHRYFENNLRQAGLLDIWRQSKQGTEMSYLIQGESVTQEDRFTEFLRFVNNYCGGRKAVAQVCLTISVGFLAFDSKKAKETANNILNIIIPSLGFTFARTGNLIERDKLPQEELLVEDEFESLLLSLGKEYLKTRRKAWDFIRSDRPDLMKNAIDEH